MSAGAHIYSQCKNSHSSLESLILTHDFSRHWQCDDFQRRAADFQTAQPLQIFLKRFVIRIVTTLFHHSHDGSLRDEPGEIIDVSVGVVAFDAVAEPKDFADAEIIP